MQQTTIYPSVFHQKILAQEAPGDVPVMLNIVVPTVTRPGKPFDVKVAVLDKNGYPSLHCDCAVELHVPEQDTASVTFHLGLPAIASLKGIQLSHECHGAG